MTSHSHHTDRACNIIKQHVRAVVAVGCRDTSTTVSTACREGDVIQVFLASDVFCFTKDLARSDSNLGVIIVMPHSSCMRFACQMMLVLSMLWLLVTTQSRSGLLY